MKRSSSIILIALLTLPLAGAVAGRLAAPGLARMNYTVWLAELVRLDELHPSEADDISVTSNKPVSDRRKAVKAFKSTNMPLATLYADATAVRRTFATGATWFGLWCGLVAALKIAALLRARRPREYKTDASHCLACARCYLACPVERERLVKAAGERPL